MDLDKPKAKRPGQLTLDEVFYFKNVAEKQIIAALAEFQAATSFPVESITITRKTVSNSRSVIVGLKIDVSL